MYRVLISLIYNLEFILEFFQIFLALKFKLDKIVGCIREIESSDLDDLQLRNHFCIFSDLRV